MAWNIVIAGGGFGGLYAARRLERILPRLSAHISLVSDTNFMLYTPLLPGAAAATLEPRHVVVPLREDLRRTDIRLGHVTGADPARGELYMTGVDGYSQTVSYDQLVVALGSVSRVLPISGLAEFGSGFKTLAEAIALRNRTLQNLEIAESIPDRNQRAKYLTFVFVGAGYAGLEAVAELQDFVADVIDRYPRCRLDGTRWVLVEAMERVMKEVPKSLADFASLELRARGIEVRTQTAIESVTQDTVTLSTEEVIAARTVCWTAGVRPRLEVRSMGLKLDSGDRIITDEYLRAAGYDNVWAIGDAAAVPDPATRGKKACPPTAQHAMRQGKLAADNIAATLGHGRLRPFRYKTLGLFVDLGRNKAVANVAGVKLRGLAAWFGARTYHLMMIPGIGRRLRLMADWTVGLLFGRPSPDLGQLGHPPSLEGYLADGRLPGGAADQASQVTDPASPAKRAT
jgi:NADH dehydrogenase